ncbi:hypothetical protein L6164_006908 [Bauhinia variegata]|uniref:Uncharacterized protein n=1 Tax=Bauhinia variegata TaxID=167791 RepID=A0ACB9PVZ7_BAUVA|nr:hypothetical protein L6164_006908 [Bauhinia variegata]
MSQSTLFSSGLEFANLAASSGLLRRSWKGISDLYAGMNLNRRVASSFSLKYRVYEELDLTIIAFVTNPICTQDHLQPDLVSRLALKENYNFPHLEFLCAKKIPSFSVNRTAVDLLCFHRDQLVSLKSQIDHSKPLIVTGHALGGSTASLFTLWLLDSIGSGKKCPLCITFGSPLIGDKNLQQAISQSSTWNSCFLHMASYQDPVPRSLITHHSSSTQTSVYKPFGIFLLSSDKGSACFEDPSTILELLLAMGSISVPNQRMQTYHYGTIVENLHRKVICKNSTPQPGNITGFLPLQASITLQLWTVGLAHIQRQPQWDILVQKMETWEPLSWKKKISDPFKRLSEAKINIYYLEWYKNESKTRGVGCYDSYKKQLFSFDQDAIMLKKRLTVYWKDMIAEAEMKPQREGAAFRIRWLFAATNYRLMVEPLDIAEYYRSGRRDYVNQGRSKHFIQLEELLKEEESVLDNLNSSRKQNLESALTLDSCFWAHVEEALLMCKLLTSVESSVLDKELATQKLIGFEDYVYGLLKNYVVSSDIFLFQSSYMIWWNEYKKIKGNSYNSTLTKFMCDPGNYKQYAKGVFDFP